MIKISDDANIPPAPTPPLPPVPELPASLPWYTALLGGMDTARIFNGLSLVALLLTAFMQWEYVAANPELMTTLGSILAFVNMLLGRKKVVAK